VKTDGTTAYIVVQFVLVFVTFVALTYLTGQFLPPLLKSWGLYDSVKTCVAVSAKEDKGLLGFFKGKLSTTTTCTSASSGLIFDVFAMISPILGFKKAEVLVKAVVDGFLKAMCWIFTYIWIRRGMNDDTRGGYKDKYFKDSLHGGLATFLTGIMASVVANYK
jgi:hypothetical protein